MATFTKFQPFVEKLAEKAFNLGSDSLKIALCASANAPVAANGVLADLTQISYTNLSSRDVTITSSSQTSGTYSLVLQDLTLTASGGSVAAFRYVVLYDDTAASDELIGFWDYGSSLTLADGESLTLDFASSTIQIA
jgi:hypothetical protein